MANGDVQAQVSAQYLQQFNLPLGVSGMQKLSEFPALQQLGYAGQLGSMKQDFHGLADFNQQMAKYSSASAILKLAWSLISSIAPNNINIARELFTSPGLGTVGQAFQSIEGFAQVFALTPADLSSPTATSSATSVYKNASTQSSVTTKNSSTQIGGGAGISPSTGGGGGAVASVFGRTGVVLAASGDYSFSLISGRLALSQIPTGGDATTFLRGDGIWHGIPSGGAVALSDLTDVIISSLLSGQFLRYNGTDWVNHSLVAADVSGLATVATTGAYSDLSGKPQLPNTFGPVTHQFVTAYNAVTGNFSSAQPSFSDISGTLAYSSLSGLPTLAQTIASSTSKWLNSYNATTGLFTATQPAFTDISGTASTAQIPSLDASKITTGQLALARGGTHADLSSTGGASQVLMQLSSGANITVSQLAYSDLSGTAPGSTVNNQTVSYTAVLSDANNIVTMTVGSANNFTVPPNSSVAFIIGTTLTIIQLGTGQTTLVAGSGVTINTPSSMTARAQYSTVSVIKIATNTWIAAGDLT